MKNKVFALLMCLVLLALGFTSASADQSTETVTTLSLKAGPLLAEPVEVGQILDTASIRIHTMPDGYGAFVLTLNNIDTLQSLFKAEQDGVYVQSGIFGQTPLYFSWEDISTFITQQMEAYAENQGLDMQAMNVAAEMESYQAMMNSAMTDGTMTDEQMYEMMGLDEDLLAYIDDIDAKKVIESGTFAINGSDEADQKIMIVMTTEDIARVLDLQMVRDQMAGQLMANDEALSQEDVDNQVAEMVAEAKSELMDSNLQVNVTVYTKNDELVAFVFNMNGEMSGYEGEATPIGIDATLTRTTIDEAKYYQFSTTVMQNGESMEIQTGSLYMSEAFVSGEYVLYESPDEPAFKASFNCDKKNADHTNAEVSFTVYDNYAGNEQSAYLTIDQQKAENVTDTEIALYVGGTVDSIKSALDETGLITLKVNTVTQPDSGFFEALTDVSPDTSVQLLQMTDEELESYMLTLQRGLTMTVLNIIDNLPPELSESVMQSMNGF
ncbi:MAG TPA: hypothetical protein PKU80_01985 [Candidatus Limiplasma sp.]|nr:hypothetical protein [Candidatus Limiplasma sp.]HRX08424.1 hypothetical protein [Candidatus Limiplasma sp.]